MPFGNPVVGGNDLIRNAIQSPNYSPDLNGWIISRDGSAELNSVSVRGPIKGVSGGFQNLSASNSFLYKGTELQTSLDSISKGIVAYGARTTSGVGTAAGTERSVLRLSAPLIANRMYAIRVPNFGLAQNSGTIDGQCSAFVRSTTNGTDPTLASPILMQSLAVTPHGNVVSPCDMEMLYVPASNQTLKLLLSFNGVITAGLYASFGNSFWPSQMYVQDIGNGTLVNTGVSDDTGGGTSLSTTTFSIECFDARSYQASGASSAGSASTSGGRMYQGNFGDFNGNWRSYCWFDGTTLAGLSGVLAGNVTYCDIYLYYDHWYFTAGGTAIIGYHTNATVQASENPLGAYNVIENVYTGRGIGKWISVLGTSIMTAILNGTFKGLIVGPDPAVPNNLDRYGYAAGMDYAANSGFRPAIRAKYSK